MTPILVSDAGPIRTITLNRPDHRNAMTTEMQQLLLAALEEAAAEKSIRLVVLTGAESAFCSGLDLATLRAAAQGDVDAPERTHDHAADAELFGRVLRTLYELPVPTIAAVNGHAIAGGTGLATVCDFTIATSNAMFGFTEVKIGFIPAIVSTYLQLQLGEKRARYLLLTGRLFTAEQGHQLGLVTEVCTCEDLHNRVHSLALTLLANSPSALRDTKALLANQNRAWLDQSLALATSASANSRQTPDFREGVTAFMEKRPPQWAG